MRKQDICRAMATIIKEKAEELGLVVLYNGTDHAFDNSFWENILTDDSDIPEIIASNNSYKIEMRSFWSSPELDIRKSYEGGREDLLVLTYSDSDYRPKEIDDRFYSCEIEELADEQQITNIHYDKVDTEEYINFTIKNQEYREKLFIHGLDCVGENQLRQLLLNRLTEIINFDDYRNIRADLLEQYPLKHYYHTGDFKVNQVRVNGNSYKELINELYDIIDRIDDVCRDFLLDETSQEEVEEDDIER